MAQIVSFGRGDNGRGSRRGGFAGAPAAVGGIGNRPRRRGWIGLLALAFVAGAGVSHVADNGIDVSGYLTEAMDRLASARTHHAVDRDQVAVQAARQRPTSRREDAIDRHFPICGSARRVTCVVDGDTFWLAGEKIRIADIDTPETGQPRCAAEARQGRAATRRLQALLNAGPFELRRGGRDSDGYGRKLRTVHRNGQSLGEVLVAEGLAHRWIGHKQSWCA